ncbi:hypothetical protein C6501_02435 [Candidatus Poribacteria bacterium]|nr:MAG: hypothetical protein C6501_02435 [Candidatus Poribacteria bacterium]
MIKNSPIVEDTRRIRRQISAKFDHNISRYIAYLQSEAIRRKKTRSTVNLSKTPIPATERRQLKTDG